MSLHKTNRHHASRRPSESQCAFSSSEGEILWDQHKKRNLKLKLFLSSSTGSWKKTIQPDSVVGLKSWSTGEKILHPHPCFKDRYKTKGAFSACLYNFLQLFTILIGDLPNQIFLKYSSVTAYWIQWTFPSVNDFAPVPCLERASSYSRSPSMLQDFWTE